MGALSPSLRSRRTLGLQRQLTGPRLNQGGGGSPIVQPGQYNFNTLQFTKSKAGIARVKAGTGRMRILVVGDSNVMAVGGGDSGTNLLINAKEFAWPTAMSKRMTAQGVQATYENLFGSGAKTGGTAIADYRNGYKTGYNPAASWVFTTSAGIGGNLLSNSADAGTFSILTQINVDTFELYDVVFPAAGASQYNIDGGAPVSLVHTGANQFRKTTIAAGSPAAHTLNLNRVSGSGWFSGYIAYNSQQPAVDIINLGCGSSATADWIVASSPWNTLPALQTLAAQADLVIIALFINDAKNSPTAYNTFFPTNMQSIYNAAKVAGADVMVSTGVPCKTTNIADSVQQNYRQALKDFAVANNVPMFDQYEKYTDWATLNALGWMYDDLHPNKLQYGDWGQFVADSVMAWAV